VERPIVLCGLGRMGTRILEYLRAANLPVVVVDNCCPADDPRLAGMRLVMGDCRHRAVLEAADVGNARGVLILTSNDLVNISTTLMVRGLNPDVRVVMRLFNQDMLLRLGHALPNVVTLSTSLLTAPVLAMTAVAGQGLTAFEVDGVEEERQRQVVEIQVGATSDLRGRAIGEVTAYRDVVTLAHLPHGEPSRFLLEVDLETQLKVGDRLVLCGAPRSLAAFLPGIETPDAAHLRWAGWPRRMARVLHRTFREIDPPVLICTAVLLTVVISSTLILRLGVQRYSVVDALFRTVSVMATGASMHEEEFNDTPAMKVFVASLRILGAALTAAFTAIVTNYLLRARLGGALEVRRIPDGGHVIICGLGSIGFRTVEELRRYGEQVVVIERDAGNRFVRAARRLGAAVIVGDAGVNEVLREAHAATSRAVIAATDDDLTNLAIALLVRELRPNQRIVLLLADPQLATMLREAADIRYALSVPMLAAPAFLACLFGDRVLSVYQVRSRLFAVIDLVIGEQDPFVSHSVRAVAVDYRLQPVAMLPREGPPPKPLLNGRLSPGDRLVGIIALPDLERLLRREPSSAAYAIDVLGAPLPARPWLAGLIRTQTGCTEEKANETVEKPPLRLADHLTRGQAEDLLARLVRERINAKLLGPQEGLPSTITEPRPSGSGGTAP
jgi:Trk K+ transport system NAD-binding subunit